ncbi:hypothetical protein S83_008112, partial [Arachis hypogaea]
TNGTYLNWEKLKKNNAAIKDVALRQEFVSENKRLKGLGIGALKGPISLDDFRSLQKSNT